MIIIIEVEFMLLFVYAAKIYHAENDPRVKLKNNKVFGHLRSRLDRQIYKKSEKIDQSRVQFLYLLFGKYTF